MTAIAKRNTLRYCAIAAAVAFVTFIIWVIIIADRADGKPWFSFIDRIPYGDKVGHLGLMSTLALLCNLAIRSKKWLGLTLVTWVLLILLTGEEISQAWFPSRHLDFFDWLCDLAGLTAGQWMAGKVREKLRAACS